MIRVIVQAVPQNQKWYHPAI